MNNFIFLVGIFQSVSAAPSLHNLDQQQCAPSAITFGQGNGGSQVTVTPSDFTTIGSTSTLKATCTADPGYIAWMSFVSPNHGEIGTLENFLPSITISLNCSSDTDKWMYYNFEVIEIKCLQAPAPLTTCLKSGIKFGQRDDAISAINVTPTYYQNDGFSHASMNATCTADPGNMVFLVFKNQNGVEFATVENFLPVVTISLTCSYQSNNWIYKDYIVMSIQCLQAPIIN